MITDLLFTLQLLDCFPDLRLTADVSHYLVGRQFAFPVDDTNHALIHRILDNAWGIHGRIASREQVQMSHGFQQHNGLASVLVHELVGIRDALMEEARRAGCHSDFPL